VLKLLLDRCYKYGTYCTVVYSRYRIPISWIRNRRRQEHHSSLWSDCNRWWFRGTGLFKGRYLSWSIHVYIIHVYMYNVYI